MPDLQTLMTGVAMGESPRWHDERLWFADWGVGEIIALDLDGASEVVLRRQSLPLSIDWLPDGRLLLVSGRDGLLLRREHDSTLVTHADLSRISDKPWNDIVVDGRGNAYIGTIGFDFPGEEFAPGSLALVTPDGLARVVADGLAFPNGVAVTPDNRTLIVAESYGERLTAFDIGSDGTLSNRRVWASVPGDHPDGICIDADNAVWYADVGGRHCVRVREGGEVLQTIDVDLGCFACMLGGPEGNTLFIVANAWPLPSDLRVEGGRTGRVLSVAAPATRAGWP
jgi:sugar lactone lactonase YvrE